VKCSNIKAFSVSQLASPEYVSLWNRPWVNDSEPITKRQLGGAKGMGGSPKGIGGGGSGGAGNGCGDDERGHVIKGGGTGMAAHMAYNQDGYYVTAASCYITKKFKEMSGAGGA
jgi:hypothetical protein